jgi:hypothetical protein
LIEAGFDRSTFTSRHQTQGEGTTAPLQAPIPFQGGFLISVSRFVFFRVFSC